jgi:hypothetical protein
MNSCTNEFGQFGSVPSSKAFFKACSIASNSLTSFVPIVFPDFEKPTFGLLEYRGQVVP